MIEKTINKSSRRRSERIVRMYVVVINGRISQEDSGALSAQAAQPNTVT